MSHFPLKKLLAYYCNQLSAAETALMQAHLDTCTFCSNNLTLLIHPEQAHQSPPASTGTPIASPKTCLTPETIGQYINHELTPSEILEVEKHLARCENCRYQLVEIFQISSAPISEEERKILEALPPLEISEPVEAIKKLMLVEAIPAEIIPKPKRELVQLIPKLRIPRLAFAFVALLFLGMAGKWWVWPTYRYSHLLWESEAQLVAENKIYYRNELRPAGDYRSSDEAEPMGPEQKMQTIDMLLKQALAYKQNGEAARLRLAQYFLLQKRYGSADSLLKLLETASPQNAAVRNDRGYWFYHQGRYDSAAVAFAQAFALNPRLDATLYNLAITQTQLGNIAAAKTSWEKYLRLDNVKTEWRNAAKTQLRELQ